MAAVGASGLSLALGVYITQQIATLKETIASISGSGTSHKFATAAVLTTPVVPPPAVLQTPKPAIQQQSFQAASSSEIKELQQRLEALESYSNSVSSSSASNSSSMSQSVSGLATNISDLEIFANATSTRSSTNEGKIVMINDEIDRLTTFATDEIVAVRDRVGLAEEAASTNASNLGLLETSVSDVATGVSDANARIDAAVALTAAVETSLATTQAAVDQSAGSITQNSNALTDLVLEMDKLGDSLTLVDGNETETRNNLASLGTSWNELNANVYVGGGWLNAVKLKATRCKLGLAAHNGQASALHFASITDPNWSMYCSNLTGRAPDGTAPQAHGGVTKNAVRMRLDDASTSGFIVEKSDGVGVFSVNTQGSTCMGKAKIADLDTTSIAFAHIDQFDVKSYAMKQSKFGSTFLNSAGGKTLFLSSGDSWKAYVNTKGFYVANSKGYQYHVGDEIASLKSKVVDLETRLDAVVSKSADFVDMKKQIRLWSGVGKTYIKTNGKGGWTHTGNKYDSAIRFAVTHV